MRVQDGRTLTMDGPFVETKEALDGYCIEAERRLFERRLAELATG